MPIYEYSCDKCHHDFEELVFGEETPKCPHCGSNQTHKLMSRPCLHCGGQGGDGDYAPPASSGRSCAGCAGGNCASCH